jgi:DoxX-like family
MDSPKRNRSIYWILTLLVLLPTAGLGIPELLGSGAKGTAEAYRTLGYPFYLMKILGFSKLAGAIVILRNRVPWLVEWAYAGFAILFLGATASHVLARDYAHAPIPFAFFLLLVGSCVFWRRRSSL